ncbi:MAG: hypothetical protein IKZ59_03655 [Clostridia bacterium]|nr:hypothetical protein [Clostridia bacterium]
MPLCLASEKHHVRFVCLLVNALATPTLHYQCFSDRGYEMIIAIVL